MLSFLKVFLFLLLTLVIAKNSFSQSKEKLIENIRIKFQSINSDTNYRKVILTGQEFLQETPDGGGELTGYFKGKELKKIHQEVGLSNGIEIMEFYYSLGQLIFVYERFNSFVYVDSLNTFDFTKTEGAFEGRYYFNNRKLIDWITSEHNRFEDDAFDPEKVLIKESDEKINLLQTKIRSLD